MNCRHFDMERILVSVEKIECTELRRLRTIPFPTCMLRLS